MLQRSYPIGDLQDIHSELSNSLIHQAGQVPAKGWFLSSHRSALSVCFVEISLMITSLKLVAFSISNDTSMSMLGCFGAMGSKEQ